MSGSSLLSRVMCLLLPSSALAGGSVSVHIKDLVAVSGIESLNIQGTDLVATVNVTTFDRVCVPVASTYVFL